MMGEHWRCPRCGRHVELFVAEASVGCGACGIKSKKETKA